MAPTLRLVGEDVLFASWPVPTTRLEATVPDPLTIDTYDGTGWVTILAHEVTDAGLDAVPMSQFPEFGEVDLRTYVRYDDDPGVHFFSCNTSQRLGTLVGDRSFGLPFTHASIDFDRRGDRTVLRCARSKSAGRGRYDVIYRPTGQPAPADAGSLAEFLVERHTYFTPDEDAGAMVIGSVERDPWQLAPVDATVRTNSLFETVGLDAPDGDPVFHYSPRFESRFVDRERVVDEDLSR
ncbi:hypothetical protein GRX01_05480 [Halobaculum sp. WSA2]|uniref:DUF2071 domain-containing protein n=1 Tax=Halobaculum saliterrae TaxID=2073113 RepID=A0A6B0SX01_9EURY|nr:DUF2071 domain-containing protein [Halobaculum saliterrae]MXR40792.1 hypothetical protein [Halobaculum saliterrae]